jgi:hypothetical protein
MTMKVDYETYEAHMVEEDGVLPCTVCMSHNPKEHQADSHCRMNPISSVRRTGEQMGQRTCTSEKSG